MKKHIQEFSPDLIPYDSYSEGLRHLIVRCQEIWSALEPEDLPGFIEEFEDNPKPKDLGKSNYFANQMVIAAAKVFLKGEVNDH